MKVTYSEYLLVALDIKHAMRMRLLLSLACPDIQYFSTISHKRKYSEKKVVHYVKYPSFWSDFNET